MYIIFENRLFFVDYVIIDYQPSQHDAVIVTLNVRWALRPTHVISKVINRLWRRKNVTAQRCHMNTIFWRPM